MLPSDNAYMKEAVEIDCMVFIDACGVLRRDFDLAVLAFSRSDSENLKSHFFCMATDEMGLEAQAADEMDEDLAFLQTVRAKAEAKVEAHEGFTAFVHGMSDFAGLVCQLPVLVRDKETSLGLKKLIAGFLDVPPGKDVPELRRAVENLKDVPLRCNRGRS